MSENIVQSHYPPIYGEGKAFKPESTKLSIKKHARVLELESSFDINAPYNTSSMATHQWVEDHIGDPMIPMFFPKGFVQFSNFCNPLVHKILSYTLSQEVLSGSLRLYAFDGEASLTEFELGDDKTAQIPDSGAFVVETDDWSVILNMRDDGDGCRNWVTIAPDRETFDIFNGIMEASKKEHDPYRGRVFDHRGQFLKLQKQNLSDVYLPDSIRSEIVDNIVSYTNPVTLARYRKNNLPLKRGVIFCGAPGTGKTYSVRALASSLDATCMIVSTLSRSTEVDFIFTFMANYSPALIVFEDVDLYIQDRHNSFDSGILGELLNKIDGVVVREVIIICTTNDVETLDKAINNRPGRFDRILKYEAPDATLRKIMLKGYCRDFVVDDVNFDEVSAACPTSFTGAHLKELFVTACKDALAADCVNTEDIVQLTTAHFIGAIPKVKLAKVHASVGFKEEED